jgi:hypothetical protein
MANRTDFLLDDNGDLLIENGDVVLGDARTQDLARLLAAAKGNWLRTPWLGIEVSNELLADGDDGKLQQEIVSQGKLIGFDALRVTRDALGNLTVTGT